MKTLAEIIAFHEKRVVANRETLKHAFSRGLPTTAKNAQEGITRHEQAVLALMLVQSLYNEMRNCAAGYSNFVEDSASTRRLEREYDRIEWQMRQLKGGAS